MDPLYLFLIQLTFTLVLMALVAAWWVLPKLRTMPVNQALAIVLFGGAIRYMGTLMLHPALLASANPDVVGAYTDLTVAVIALAGIFANRANSAAGRPLAWLYTVVGGIDMMVVFIKGLKTGTWANLTGGWTFVVAVFPLVGVALFLTLILLIRPAQGTVRESIEAAA